MVNCTEPPFIINSQPGFFMTNAVILPLIFGIGVIGNTLTLIVLNRSHIRIQHPLFVYLTGLAALDLLILLLLGPVCLRDMGALVPDLGYSQPMAYYTTLQYTANNILKHSSLWVLAFAALIRYISRVYPKRRLRWTRISSSRIIVFVLVLFCVLVDFPRFFERKVQEFGGHCFDDLVIWWWRYTAFSRRSLYTEIYPWIVVATCVLLPTLILTIFTFLLCFSTRIFRVLKERGTKNYKGEHNSDVETNLALILIIFTYAFLEIPDTIAFVLQDLYRHEHLTYNFQYFVFAAHCISLVHSCVNFFIYLALSTDFRKTLRRTLCCCYHCIHGDDYYEPIRCPCAASSRANSVSDTEEDTTDNIYQEPPHSPRKNVKSQKPVSKKKDKEEDLMWI